MLRRKATEKLKSWKEAKAGKCLVISGPRQCGKTFIVERFGEKEYASFIELNFIKDESLCRIFAEGLDAETILMNIRIRFPEKKIIPGSTLILLDEIQECERAVTALKFLATDERVDVVATGSLLGIRYKTKSSYPVGSVDYLDMYALDFEEFLWAQGIDEDVIGVIGKCFAQKQPVPAMIHEQMMRYLRQYMVLGGMPEVLNVFLKTRDYYEADQVQRRIYRDYLADIARYAEPSVKIKAEKCYRSIPLQLSKENHKFQYSVVEHKGNEKKFGSSVDWILNAGMAMAVCNVGHVEYPAAAHALDDNLRLYNTDIGLLICTYDFSLKSALLEDEDLADGCLGNPVLHTAKGGLYEALAADMLLKAGHKDLFFYRNEPGTVELEFLLDTADGLIPVEVKAGRSGTRSLNNLLKKEDIRYGYKLSSQNVGVQEKKITLPLYMAWCV